MSPEDISVMNEMDLTPFDYIVHKRQCEQGIKLVNGLDLYLIDIQEDKTRFITPITNLSFTVQ